MNEMFESRLCKKYAFNSFKLFGTNGNSSASIIESFFCLCLQAKKEETVTAQIFAVIKAVSDIY
jgi:hypothetical protein